MNKLDEVPDEPHDSESDSDGPAELNVFCDVYPGIRQIRSTTGGISSRLTLLSRFCTPVDELFQYEHPSAEVVHAQISSLPVFPP